MGSYRYQGREQDGRLVQGELEAASLEAATEQLYARRIMPTQVRAKGQSWQLGWERRARLEDLLIFCRQMYSLTKAGIPILRAISGLAETSRNQLLRDALFDVAGQLEAGRNLSTAMSRHPRIFTRLLVSIVHVGENTGRLDQAFLQLAEHLSQEQETRRRVRTAVRYPSFVVAAIMVALVVVNIFVIPTFAGVFARFNAELPWPTQLLIGMSNAFTQYWYLLVLLVLAGGLGWWRWQQSEHGQLRWSRWKLHLPAMGSIIERALLARFCRSLSMMLDAGVPLPQALTLVADAVDNLHMKGRITGMRQGIESGESLLRTANHSQLFTPLVLQMMAVGEETGSLDEMLAEAGEFYEREVDYDLETLTARIEPILIALVAVMVLILALGIFLPMWDLMGAYKGR
ncbi:type II secretion system F family protein [Gallaecimonas sp. GXIMD4217]|uniref:type II secretion system F family protein n=1 Tax=Gallaecimonas sp. GXIMD4217 TaxID=3131927 RepID=UPI00311B061A